jgi:hypothetical protein
VSVPENYSKFFVLIDRYAREHHNCYCAELFQGSDPAVYTICFRPSSVKRKSSNRYACRYLEIAVADAHAMVAAGSLSNEAVTLLDRELRLLPQD